ncbi:FAD/NAD(P)-binding protein [Ruegeria sp. Ofav3-42]|uniref:NAD(P)-binding protein n=1 Tax=Ruegeria sp. Ofav3-42 TaxID=2917759 RepID=UPI001EF67585|nr:NAD(P)-binding protein [Ruegeria sp. Ofav3-42]MCG7522046.1 NAD(P)-binding protein [Ruegeria sp. Ofav3-42]
MAVTETEADYLVVGAGAMGMAFADTILSETSATVVIVDKNDKPGGHWNYAYPFVRLHQPSAYYGVNSRALGSDHIDQSGLNKGMRELASVSEILAYFDRVMRNDFLESGRVAYFPQSEFLGDGRIRSIASGRITQVNARKTVDTTYMNVKVPQTDPPKFPIDEGVRCVAPNALAALPETPDRFVVIGGGKTGIDSCLYLLDLGVDPERIDWIVPRDSWLLDRANVQPAGTNGVSVLQSILMQISAISESTSVDDMFTRVSACGGLLRLSDDVTPSMYRCATVSRAELEELRRIPNVIRKGRVQRLEAGRAVLDQGILETPENTVFVNCTSDGLEKRPPRPVFDGDLITIQAVRPCQQLFSAALIAHVEATYENDAQKNAICEPTPHPDSDMDYLQSIGATLGAQMKWAADPELLSWLVDARLDGITTPDFAAMMHAAAQPGGDALLQPAMIAMGKISQYLTQKQEVPA